MFLKLLASIVGTLLSYGLYHVLKLVYQELNSPVRHLPGPRSNHFIYGSSKDLMRDMADGGALQEKWVEMYGRTLKYPFFFGLTRLYTTDTKALNHFLTNHNIYQRPPHSRYLLSLIVGPGVLVTEGEVHKRQRKVMGPAFGVPQLRELTSIFFAKSAEVRNIWASEAADSPMRLDVLSWLNKTTLDIIGLAGFDYSFNSLNTERPTELATAFGATMQATVTLSAFDIIPAWVPALRACPTKFAVLGRASQKTMSRIGREILRGTKTDMAESGTFETGRGRDLLSLLVRANTAKDVPENQRLSENEVLAQVPTFLAAGHETTSTGTTWALFALTQNIPAQTRLRAELLGVETETPAMDELNALPYLDCVVREALRLNPPVVSTSRVATQDDVVPLDTPWTDAHGVVHETLGVTKGQNVIIPILAMNRDKTIWGPDATEFIPERWESETPISNNLPGVWGQTLTFLGGPRACIGYRFSVVEMKALLFTLVRAFEFELAVPAADIGRKISIVQHPFVRSDPGAGAQMPLIVKPYLRPM
ncbi:cytochrome P450 [Mycena olivaceomarginata]|nr:cytochrome P450 [Mycena olivaceomarginata]